jgi:hypothetical protein
MMLRHAAARPAQPPVMPVNQILNRFEELKAK